MLTSSTKQKIDNARDILVGKIPTPTGQVEHITLALMYKFMNDMDEINRELGGTPKFFSGDYRQYSWKQIMDRSLSSYERVALYGEGLEKMSRNPNIPALFREIFKRAFLPFRDPEVLTLFLKQIDEFTYDHSEELGNAFEYLLSIMGTQGEAGQLRSPRHIIDFMVNAVDPKKTDRILDPACGTAGFLISAYKHILEENTVKGSNRAGSKLTLEERKRLAQNFVGYDISHDMVRLSLVNMYLHEFPDPKIYEYDTLTSEERWDEDFDCILANPPFMTPKGGIRPHRRFSIQANRSEVLFVDYIMEHLSPNGKAGVIVPEGIIFQSANAYKALRKMLVEQNYIYAVVSLPAGVFQPYSGVKTSILLMDRVLAKKTEDILFVKIENDGFDLGAQRRPIEKNDLPKALELLQAYKKALVEGCSVHPELVEGYKALLVPKSRIAESGDYNLTGDRYKEIGVHVHHEWPMVSVGELCNLINGRAFKPTDWTKKEQGGLPIIRIQNLNNADAEFNYYSGIVAEKYLVNTGDLLFSWSGSKGSSFGPHIWTGTRAILNQHIFRVEHSDSVIKEYLYMALKKLVAQVEDNLHGGVGLVHITKGNLEKLKIPLPSLEVQRGIVTEIEGYQKVIHGARAVLDNYRPYIPIHRDWPMVELREIIQDKPKNGYSGKPVAHATNLKVLSLSATTSGTLDLAQHKFLEEDIPLDSPCRCKRGDIYLQRGNTKELVGTAAIFDVDEPNFIYPDLMIRVRADETRVMSHYLLYVLQNDFVRDYVTRNAVGSAGSMPKINQGIVERIPVPLPPLETQKQIVAQIEEEQRLVEANKKLVEIFERKIRERIDEVWGRET